MRYFVLVRYTYILCIHMHTLILHTHNILYIYYRLMGKFLNEKTYESYEYIAATFIGFGLYLFLDSSEGTVTLCLKHILLS